MGRTRGKTAFQRGRLVPLLVAAGVGYLVGVWHAQMVRGPQEPSAAQAVALRFPQELNVAEAQPLQRTSVSVTDDATMVIGSTQLALFDPAPMVPHAAMVAAPPAAAGPADPVPAAAPPPPPKPVLASVAKPRPAAAHPASRPGYMLDDAQIASIKRRLHLTPEQEEMWPAVEVALRNIGSAKGHRRGTRTAALDPNSSEVQDLKSAAIPLLMSFSSEQKDEVRSLVHVMGLDQLASQF